MSRTTVFFLHIPRTGGSTVEYLLGRQYDAERTYAIDGDRVSDSIEQLGRLPEARKRELDLVMGHMIYGIDTLLPQECVYVTMLRHPVGRILSMYGYMCSSPHHYLHERVSQMTLAEFAQSDLTTELDNWQTSAIAGPGEESTCTEETFARACDHLATRFRAVGLTERFDESILLMQQAFGWKRPFYVRINVGTRPGSVPSRILDAIRERNAYDLKLFDHVRARLDAEIEHRGRAFASRLALFRTLNRGFAAARRVRDLARPTAAA